MNNLDLINCVNVKQAVEALKDAPRGNWYLCCTYLPIAPTTRPSGALQQSSISEESGELLFHRLLHLGETGTCVARICLPFRLRGALAPRSKVPSAKIAENCGFIIRKNRNIVTFYNDDLAGAPQDSVCPPDSHSIRCVHGLVKIKRWQGNEAPHPTITKVPVILLACNLLINRVNRFD